MKIKTLQDLSDNFEVLSRSEEKETLGGVDLISTADGYIYDVNMASLGYVNSTFTDTDPWNLGGSFSYVVDGGYGSPVTINVNEADWGSNAYGPNRFSLIYVDPYFNTDATSTKIYYDSLTGYSFSASFFRSMEAGGGYNYEALPDIKVSDNDMGSFSGYTLFHSQLEKYLNYDELTGAYQDYSRIISTSTHYDADYIGMINAGYSQQKVNEQVSAGHSLGVSAGDMSSLMNNLNGSKLAARQKAWTADPDNHGKDFSYMDYARISLDGYPSSSANITVIDQFGISSGSLREFYDAFKAQVELYGVQNVHSFLYTPW